MRYIILAAGRGTRLHPFTKNLPKCMLNLGFNETIAQRMIRVIRKYDSLADITVVTGFRRREIEEVITGCEFISNPFYEVTNSIASLWFARHLLVDNVTIINGDIVCSEKLMQKVAVHQGKAVVFVDGSIKSGDYNVQVSDGHVIVMSKQLNSYYGEYAGICKLDSEAGKALKQEICRLVDEGNYNEWYENALVQMILNYDFPLEYCDISDYEWAEVDCVNNLTLAKELQKKEWNGG